jgi:hypothetical protein
MQLPGGADAHADAGDDEENNMWKVIEGVWVEMLCFSAGRCRGFPARQEPCLRRGVPHLRGAPHVEFRIGDVRGQAAKDAAPPFQRGEAGTIKEECSHLAPRGYTCVHMTLMNQYCS